MHRPAPPAARARFVLAASSGASVRTRAGEAAPAEVDVIELSPVDAIGRRLLEGPTARVFRSAPLGRPGAAPGAIGSTGWSRLHATLEVPVARSVAHDLDNVPTVVVGHADLPGLELDEACANAADTPVGQALAEIRLAAEDAADFAREAGATVALESAPGAGCEIALHFPAMRSRAD